MTLHLLRRRAVIASCQLRTEQWARSRCRHRQRWSAFLNGPQTASCIARDPTDYCFSTMAALNHMMPPPPPPRTGEKLRVAVVGGSCAGLTAALHLAPLVEQGYIDSPIDIYDAPSASRYRDIGVGIWSTALEPLVGDRTSHQLVLDEMQQHGSWLGAVGYRTISGAWLAKSRLATSLEECRQRHMPALLFLRERDFMQCLQKAIHWETRRGTVAMHQHQASKSTVGGVEEHGRATWSTRLLLDKHCVPTERDYHLIVAADGTHSVLRHAYGGHEAVTRILTGTAALQSPLDLPTHRQNAIDTHDWDAAQQLEAVGVQDRHYTVFRGNAPITQTELGLDGNTSFQTWGEGTSMRFATVPMYYPSGVSGRHEERQVWFATIDDDALTSEADLTRRKGMLLQSFASWHDPVGRIVEATDADLILMDRAVAHRHCMGPVTSLNKVIQRKTGTRPPSSGDGACLVFVGDAYMTIDPILAQGFTCAMEGAFALRHAVQQACYSWDQDPTLAFDPYALRRALQERHDDRLSRLICLLRATELVQALGQPSGGTLGGWMNTRVLRPLTRVVPNSIKAPLFNAVLKYSLGLPQR